MPAPATAPRPFVTIRPCQDDDDGHRHVVCIAGMDGRIFDTLTGAELYADELAVKLAAALAPLAGVAARVEALLASPEARDAVAGRCAAPASAALAVLRWVRSGPAVEAGERDDEDVLHPGDAPTLDRLITGAGCAIVCGEEDPS